MGMRLKLAAGLLTVGCLASTGMGVAHAEVLNGTGGADTLNGTAKSDKIFGRGGNDTLDGRRGADLIKGGAGNDHISDGFDLSADRIYGGEGRDYITTIGPDRVFSGPGNDSFDAARVGRGTFINCGPGEDFVRYLDKKPRTKGCEHVDYSPAG